MDLAVWAIDPFDSTTRPDSAAQLRLAAWLRASSIRVVPVHLLEVGPHEEVNRYIPTTRHMLGKYVEGMDLPSVEEGVVLLDHSTRPGGRAKQLIDYAVRRGARWILTSSHAKGGLERLACGSFAESLLTHSPIPVRSFGRGADPGTNPRRILFATDFSEEADLAFEATLVQARHLGASVTIYHAVTPMEIFMGDSALGGMAYTPVSEYVESRKAWAGEAGSRWVDRARVADVSATLIVKEVFGSVSEAICHEAEADSAGTIAMASRTGPVGAALLGSHARQILRASHCTVWVYGPEYFEKSAVA